jgi:hypothetical protein
LPVLYADAATVAAAVQQLHNVFQQLPHPGPLSMVVVVIVVVLVARKQNSLFI